ncbi:hypothetical protein YT1_p10027 (plasmid) [Rhodococcus ruber]|nr:hypothetical protein YT1_p10027 [Rhodococcus ruber]
MHDASPPKTQHGGTSLTALRGRSRTRSTTASTPGYPIAPDRRDRPGEGRRGNARSGAEGEIEGYLDSLSEQDHAEYAAAAKTSKRR